MYLKSLKSPYYHAIYQTRMLAKHISQDYNTVIWKICTNIMHFFSFSIIMIAELWVMTDTRNWSEYLSNQDNYMQAFLQSLSALKTGWFPHSWFVLLYFP